MARKGKINHKKKLKRAPTRIDKTRRYKKDVDQIYEEIVKGSTVKREMPVDHDLPGYGQFYCMECDRYFINEVARSDHLKTKKHKTRLKQLRDVYLGPESDGQILVDNGPLLGRAPNKGELKMEAVEENE